MNRNPLVIRVIASVTLHMHFTKNHGYRQSGFYRAKLARGIQGDDGFKCPVLDLHGLVLSLVQMKTTLGELLPYSRHWYYKFLKESQGHRKCPATPSSVPSSSGLFMPSALGAFLG